MNENEKNNLFYDVLQRFQAIKDAIDKINLSHDAKILDVGGSPCKLADFLKPLNIYTVDTVKCLHEKYILASGGNLPFTDNAFDAVLSSDTLEHIPAKDRDAFLSEIYRAASDYIIIAAPFASKETDFCENAVAEIYEIVEGKPHFWFREHIEYGLPDLEKTAGFFLSKNSAVDIYANCNLKVWLIFEMFENILKGLPEFFEAFNAAMPDINSLSALKDDSEPSYRKILIIRKKPETAPSKIAVKHFSAAQNTGATLEELRHIAEIYTTFAKKIRCQKDWLKTSEASLSAEAIARFEAAFAAQEKALMEKDAEIKSLREQIQNNPKGKLGKILKKFR